MSLIAVLVVIFSMMYLGIKKITTNKRCVDSRLNQLELGDVLNQFKHAVIITDSNQNVIKANKAAANFLGFNHDMASGKNLLDLTDNSQLCEALVNYTQDRVDDFVYPQVMHEDGIVPGFNQVEFSVLDIGIESCIMTILSGSHHDEYATKIRERFIDRASHEFRTPLAAIQAYIEMLLDGEADDEKTRHAFYNIIQSETKRLTSLVEKILKISSIEAGEIKTNMRVINFDTLLDSVILEAKDDCGAKNIDLLRVANISREESMIFADKELLSEAINNIITNAIKFTPRDNVVKIETDVDVNRGVVLLEVSDNGVGISEKELPYIFEKFYRGETNEWYAKGAGLGLSLTKHIIKDVHGGTIKASSEISMGSVFRIELPLRSSCVKNSARASTHVKGSLL